MTLSAGLIAVALAACGSSSHRSASSSTATPSSTQSTRVGTRRDGGVSAIAVERALLAHGGPPAPTRAACHLATAAERASSPFGRTKLPIFICELTIRGTAASYAVQVQANNCFVAERGGGGQAVYGCGVVRS